MTSLLLSICSGWFVKIFENHVCCEDKANSHTYSKRKYVVSSNTLHSKLVGWGLSPWEWEHSDIGYALLHSQQCTSFSSEYQEIWLCPFRHFLGWSNLSVCFIFQHSSFYSDGMRYFDANPMPRKRKPPLTGPATEADGGKSEIQALTRTSARGAAMAEAYKKTPTMAVCSLAFCVWFGWTIGAGWAERLTSGSGRAWGCDSPALLDFQLRTQTARTLHIVESCRP